MIQDLRLEYKDYLIHDKQLAPISIKTYMIYFDRLSKYQILNQVNATQFIRQSPNNVAKAFLKSFIEYCKLNPESVDINGLNLNDISNIVIIKVSGRKKKRIPKYITEDEVLNLVYNVNYERLRLMMLIQYYGALRIGELLSITIGNCNFARWFNNKDDDLEIKVYGKGNKEGITYIPAGVAERLAHYIMEELQASEDERNLRLFDLRQKNPITYEAYDMWLNRFSDFVLGIKYSSHSFRHGRINQLLSQGVGIEYLKDFARHSSIVSTQFYLHLNQDALRNELRKVRIPIKNTMVGFEEVIREDAHLTEAEQYAKDATKDISRQIQTELDNLDNEDNQGDILENEVNEEEFED
jgi:integrase